jgi:hypothetical protein
MFYVRHHDEQVHMFNAKCQAAVLVNHMKKAMGVPPTTAIDLVPQAAEYKNAQPIGLAEKPETIYGNTFLALRGSYILVSYVEDEEGIREYKVLLSDKPGGEHDKLHAALDLKTQDERKKAGGKKVKK